MLWFPHDKFFMIRFFLCYFLSKVLGSTRRCNKLVKKKKEIKIIRESDTNYTFLNADVVAIKREPGNDVSDKVDSNIEKEIIKTRSLDSKKSKLRHKGRIPGGQNKQGHSSVYE